MGLCLQGFSQTTNPPSAATTAAPASADFFAGKWEISVVGLPDGDAKFVTELIRKDGKLTGELKDPAGVKPAVKITKVDEEAGKVTIHFDTDQAGDVPLELAKVDETHLKGQLFSMFDATAVRGK